MPSYPLANLPINVIVDHPNANTIIDQMLTPRLLAFRMLCIFDEQGTVTSDQAHWKWSYANWNPGFDLIVRKNGKVLKAGEYGLVDYNEGTIYDTTISLGADRRPRDVMELTYQFDYFPPSILLGIITQAIDFVNTAAVGPATDYNIDNMPDYWAGVVTDLSFAVCMERLLLDYTLWRGKVIFALGPNEFETGGGDIVSTLQILKSNAEERANKTLDNERFKIGNYESPPTQIYYNAIRGVGGGRLLGPNNSGFYGKLRGWRPNKIWGNG